MTLESRIVKSARPDDRTPATIRREFLGRLADGEVLKPQGRARQRPKRLLTAAYLPKYRLDLFDATIYLNDVRQNPDIRFFVANVTLGDGVLHPRIFYKDVSLIWRSASHMIRTEGENWIGKGDLRTVVEGGVELEVSAEETTDLPLELQDGLEELARRPNRVPRDDVALSLVLRQGPSDRMDPYRDFSEPRARAAADPTNLVHGGKPIARFTRRNDPTSLRFAKGYEPDFGRGVLETSRSKSRLYGGNLRRFRILSRNRRVQYLFFAGPRHVWIIPPQATTTELSSYALRTVDAVAPDDLCVPGYEYHFMDDSLDPPELHTQIPEGWAGAPSEHDPSRADASPWLEQLPVVQEFRRKLLKKRR